MEETASQQRIFFSVKPQINASDVLALAGGAFALIGVLIFVWQLIVWRTTAEWHPFSFATLLCDLGLPELHRLLDWAGLPQIKSVTRVLDLPASLALVSAWPPHRSRLEG
jgi:hypothetical protein